MMWLQDTKLLQAEIHKPESNGSKFTVMSNKIYSDILATCDRDHIYGHPIMEHSTKLVIRFAQFYFQWWVIHHVFIKQS